jgi:hypothetical protein
MVLNLCTVITAMAGGRNGLHGLRAFAISPGVVCMLHGTDQFLLLQQCMVGATNGLHGMEQFLLLQQCMVGATNGLHATACVCVYRWLARCEEGGENP